MTMVYKDKIVVQTYIPKELYNKLLELSKDADVSLSKYIHRILRQHVESLQANKSTENDI